MKQKDSIIKAYNFAQEYFAGIGVDTEAAISRLENISLSLPCWQDDDVCGFEKSDSELSGGGIQVTGNYPGKACNANQLRMDIEKVLSLIPGSHRLNLHAMYGEFKGETIDRNEIGKEHFQGWIDWAIENKIGIDFNSTLFSHPMSDSGFTISSSNEKIRKFWIEHVKASRKISAYIGSQLGNTCIHNLWIPDGSKDIPYNRWENRELLKDSLDDIFEIDYPANEMKDAVESKLFGIGSESFVVGSHDFYLCYAMKNKKMICLDLGHFHPTESVADKISAIMQFADDLLLHVSRGVRWDSDHVPILNEEIMQVAQEIIRNNLENKVYIALDFFDATINRIGAYIIGARSVLKSLLIALLEPSQSIIEAEKSMDYLMRLAYLEAIKNSPYGQVWDYYCLKNDVPTDFLWIKEVKQYEKDVLSQR